MGDEEWQGLYTAQAQTPAMTHAWSREDGYC